MEERRTEKIYTLNLGKGDIQRRDIQDDLIEDVEHTEEEYKVDPRRRDMWRNICCTPFVEVYHPWIFTPSMDKRISSSVRFTRLVAGGSTNLKKIHGSHYTIHG